MTDWGAFTQGLTPLADAITIWRERKGFLTPMGINTDQDRTHMNEKLMLCVTELAEACEAVRHANFANFKEELADTMIRILDICGACGIDIGEEIVSKMVVNEGRAFRHGKAC